MTRDRFQYLDARVWALSDTTAEALLKGEYKAYVALSHARSEKIHALGYRQLRNPDSRYYHQMARVQSMPTSLQKL